MVDHHADGRRRERKRNPPLFPKHGLDFAPRTLLASCVVLEYFSIFFESAAFLEELSLDFPTRCVSGRLSVLYLALFAGWHHAPQAAQTRNPPSMAPPPGMGSSHVT